MNKVGQIPHIIWMFYSILLYEIAGLFSLFFGWANYLCMFGVIISIISFYRAPKSSLPVSTKISVLILYVTLVFMILRGSLIGRMPHLYGEGPLPDCSLYDIMRYFLVNPNSTFALCFPFVIMIDWSPNEFKYWKSLAIVSSILSLFAFFIFKDYIVSADAFGMTNFSNASGSISVRVLANTIFVGLGIILCIGWSFKYVKHNQVYWILLIVIFLNFYCHVLGGGRGNSVIAFGYIVLFFYFQYKSINLVYRKKSKSILFFVVLFGVFIAIVYYLSTKTSFLDLLIRRTFEDGDINSGFRESTREDFMNAMIADFNNDPLSWIFGRGVNGCYSLGGNVFRSSLEWGYMWLILKGGIIYLLLYVWILLKAFFNGYRHSNNTLAKALAFLCLVQVLVLIPFGLPSVSVQCLLVWHSVRLLNSNRFLRLSDSEIQQFFDRSR